MKRIRACTLATIGTIAIYLAAGACGNSEPSDIRPAAVSDRFYPGDPGKLKLAIQQFLKGSPEIPMDKPIALLVPHAAYIFSGQICADAFRQATKHRYDVVVILGTNHTTPDFRGISLGDYSVFRTPLGDVPIDKEVTTALLAKNKDCTRSRAVHIGEHSIEVQVPFVQVLFPNAKIVPAVVHPPDYEMCTRFGQTLAQVLQNRRALIVISSDLSHYPDYEGAVKTDHLTLKTIASLDSRRVSSLMKSLDIPNLDTRACGEAALLAGMTAAKALGATRAVVVGYANSGDVPLGEKSRVVGYGAVVLVPGIAPSSTSMLNRSTLPSSASPLQGPEKKALLAFARETIERYVTTQTVPLARNFPARMNFPQGVFVTLKKAGELRGCIGHIPGDIELGKAVGAMAYESAFNDPRFPPVQLSELKSLEIEISVLTPMKPIASTDEIVLGRDGVVMSKSGQHAVFLPQVAVEYNWSRTEMLDNLCKKAGLPSGCWKRDAQFQVFQAEVFGEFQ
jgi:AmmeMemoRadiSam system protein B/AmmeMemoRadiSam system protein A